MLRKWLDSFRPDPASPSRRRGFAEASAAFVARPIADAHAPWSAGQPPPAPPRPGPAPFATIGPEGHRARMREKVLGRGTEALADYELLEMLLFLAFKTGDTKPLAKSLINRFGSLGAVLAAPQDQLLATRGLGPHAVTALRLVHAAAIRMARADIAEQPVLSSPEKLLAYLHLVLAREHVEQFRVLFLNPRNRLIADEAQARGTVDHTPVYPREIVKRALELHATAVILVHNHPSGDPSPSDEDLDMTREIVAAGRLLSIRVHDHLVIGQGRSVSFRELGLLP